MKLEKIIADALDKVEQDKYILSAVISKRANELMKGAKPMYETDIVGSKFTTIALNEIALGLLDPKELID